MSNKQNEIINEMRYEYECEMQCYCEKNHKKGTYSGACPNSINYIHHKEWGRPEDYMCEDCLDKCEV